MEDITSASTSEVSSDDGGVSVSSAGDSSDPNPSSTNGEATTDPSSDGGSDFVPDASGGDLGCGQECDIWNPGDCPDGEKCTMVACEIGSNSWDSHVCREVQGDAQVGDACFYTDGSGVSGNDTCALGSVCWNADADTGFGTCLAFCEGSADVPICPEGGSCNISGSGILSICFPGCDPLAQDCDASNDLCIPDPDGGGYVCVFDASGDMAPYGTPCNYVNSCNTGLLCIDAAGVPEAACASAAGCCSPMCDLDEMNSCPGAGQTCEPVFDPQPEDYEHVGVCTIVP
jgi:hypothetical protein